MDGRLVLIGKVAGAFGVRGQIRILAYGEDPLALLRYKVLRLKDGRAALTLSSGRAAKAELIATAAEIASKESADALRGVELYVSREVLPPLEEDEFYLEDLTGLVAQTREGARLGVVKAVQNFGAGDLLEIAPDEGPAFYLPFTRAVVPEIDLTSGRLVVDPPLETE